jgi:hypothetical protein
VGAVAAWVHGSVVLERVGRFVSSLDTNVPGPEGGGTAAPNHLAPRLRDRVSSHRRLNRYGCGGEYAWSAAPYSDVKFANRMK